MAVQQQDPIKGAPAGEVVPQGGTGWLARIDEIGQKHARLIITICVGLVVLIVLVVANVAYKSSLAERVSRDISTAGSVEQLKELKAKYADADEVAFVVATLANRLHTEGKLDEAIKEYDEFLERFPNHALRRSGAVARARAFADANRKFESEDKAALVKVAALDSHPLKDIRLRDELPQLREELAKVGNDPARKAEADAIQREIDRRLASPIGIGPLRLPNPVLMIKFKDKDGKPTSRIQVELFEDLAPNAVASLVELAEKKYFDGLKFTKVNGEERIQVDAKKDNPVTYALGFEKTNTDGDVGSLVLVRDGANNKAAEFQLLLNSVATLADVTVCGVLGSSDLAMARKLAADDVIESVTVEKKRAHEYKATPAK